jgi:hypothetical protein
MPVLALVLLDVAASYMLASGLHSVGVVYRESIALRTLMPFPAPPELPPECATPSRPLTEIERAMLERQKQ